MRLEPVSALLLDEAATLLAEAPDAPVLVLDDPALAGHLHTTGRQVRAYCDDLRDELQLPFPGLDEIDEAALTGVRLVLLRLPKSLGLLEDYAERVARWAGHEVRLLAGGREKHLNRSMNLVLAASFGEVRASLGRQKSRVLIAAGPTPGPRSWPRTTVLADPPLTVVSHAGVFAAARLDAGTRLLLGALPHEPFGDGWAADLGSGSGILAATLAGRGWSVRAVDVSRAACAATTDTAAANGVEVMVERADGLPPQPVDRLDLVVCNPPFHVGTAKDSTPGFDLVASALPHLATGGQVWTVFNSHLPYLQFLRGRIGPTRVVARDRDYTVTLTTARGR